MRLSNLLSHKIGKILVLFNMSSTALVKAATTAVSNKLIQRAATQAVKTAAPSIAKAAVAAATTKAVKSVSNRMKVNQTTRSSRAFAPVAYTTNYSNSGKVVRIAQSEIVATIDPNQAHWYTPKTPSDYSIMGLRLSPSNETTFPWLANVAGLFDKFRFRKLSFTFVTTKPTNTQGTVSMAVDFDAYDSTPSDVIEMSNLAKFTTNPVYVNKTVEIPLNHPGNRSWYYNFDGSSGDLKTYNLGTFYICLAGVKEKNSHGYLVVNYDVELCDKNPKLTKTKTTMSPDGVITQHLSDDTQPSPTPPPDEDQDPWQFWYTDSHTIVNPTSFFEFTDSGSLYFHNVQGGQNIIGTLYWFDAPGRMTCTPGDAPEASNNVAVGSYRLVGNTNLIAVSFALTVTNDGEATINIPVTGIADKTNLGTVFCKDANTST